MTDDLPECLHEGLLSAKDLKKTETETQLGNYTYIYLALTSI